MTAELARPVLNVGIVTVDIERMARFYTGCFGFEPLPELVFPGTGVVHRFLAGDSILRITVPEVAPATDGTSGDLLSATGYRYMTLNVRDVATAARATEDHGGTVAFGPVTIRPGVTIAQVRDPDGNWIELVEEG